MQFSNSMTRMNTPSPTVAPGPLTPMPTFLCGMSTQMRSDAVFSIASSISDSTALQNDKTPQGEVLDWLLNEDALALCPDDASAVLQRYAIAVFYVATEAEKKAKDLSPLHECDWSGITCNSAQDVFVLNIDNQNLKGQIPSEITALNELRVIKLEENKLEGTIPVNIGDMKNLIAIDLNSNKMSGTIPDSLYTLTNLQQLDIDDNKFTGTLSPSVQNLSNLSFLQLEENKFTGPIPESLGSLVNLEQATFDNNDFSGSMPESVCENRGDGSVGGKLVVLNADCPPQFDCSCCTIICNARL